MKKFLVVFLATVVAILTTVPVGCSSEGGYINEWEKPCIWMDNVCYCRGFPHKVIHITSRTDTSKMYNYCKGQP